MTVSNSDIAVTQDFSCVRGDSFNRVFKFWTDDTKTTPVDITAMTFRMQVKVGSDSSPLLSFTIGAGFTITAPNILTMSKTDVEMQGLQTGGVKYDIEQTDAEGNVTTIFRGSFIIIKDYTI